MRNLLLAVLLVCLLASSMGFWKRRSRRQQGGGQGGEQGEEQGREQRRGRGGWSRTVRRAWNYGRRVAGTAFGKRDMPAELLLEADLTNDGDIDQSEAEKLFNARDLKALEALDQLYDE